MALIIERGQLPFTGTSYELEGYLHGDDVPISLILVDSPPGDGPDLHTHPYAEIFIPLEGQATYTAGDQQIEVRPGQIVIVPPNEPHRFVNTGTGRLRQIDIHCSGRFNTTWLGY